ncbi:MAG: hypothetical protein RL508_1005, partial [Actinomycetota bacterium]
MKPEQGSGTVLFLALVGVSIVLAGAISAGGTLALRQSKLQAATDAA